MIDGLVVNLKARLQPMHRGDLEEGFLEYCQMHQLALDVIGGGTLMAEETGEPLECDIEIGGVADYQITQDDVQKVAQFFNDIFAPQGSSLKIYSANEAEPQILKIGQLQGLSLRLNGSDLPEDVYKNHDINDVISELHRLMGEGELGQMHSFYEGSHTYLYFYGQDFEQMKNAITPFVDTHSLCQQSQIVQIA